MNTQDARDKKQNNDKELNRLKREEIKNKIFSIRCMCPEEEGKKCQDGYYANICLNRGRLCELLISECIQTVRGKTQWQKIQLRRLFPEMKNGDVRHIEIIEFEVRSSLKHCCNCVTDKCCDGFFKNVCISDQQLIHTLNSKGIPTIHYKNDIWDEHELTILKNINSGITYEKNSMDGLI